MVPSIFNDSRVVEHGLNPLALPSSWKLLELAPVVVAGLVILGLMRAAPVVVAEEVANS